MKDFDELLDGVLREDASAQPRTGLEARVMARVRTDGQRRPVWRLVTWGMIAAALPVCVVALLVWPRSVSPVRHMKEVPAVSGSMSPERAAAEPVRTQPRRVAEAKTSVRHENTRVVYEEKSFPKLDVFPTPSVVAEPVRELAEVSQRHPGEIVPGLADSAAERKPPAALNIEPIVIAKIEIAPLYPVQDPRAKEAQGR
ncbi:hypothetical protein P8936_16005 [Edaphobacter paludis]|uniref:Uncharacterized protein n=1 Tax=Edaphobacter paludis TaxID=3035702 RepID=A0AAU7CVU9_9BACT